MIAFVALFTMSTADSGLRDHPVAAVLPPRYLDGGAWTASTLPPPSSDGGSSHHQPPPKMNATIAATVPGDLITDMQRSNLIPDPWLDTTWIHRSALWSDHTWTYTTTFDASAEVVAEAAAVNTSTLLLVLEGVKMGATVRVNGHSVGVVRDQFLRYVFELDAVELGLMAGDNRLDIIFGVEDVAEDGRFMACTGGWDWAPYSHTSTNSSGNTSGPAVTFSKGIWKSVYTLEVPAATAAITHLTPHTHFRGAYPTVRLVDGEHGGFTVNVTAHFWAPQGGATGALAVAGSWADNNNHNNNSSIIDDISSDNDSAAAATAAKTHSGTITLPAGESMISLQLAASAAQVKLWWPAGVGSQPLYNVTATWTSEKAAAAAADSGSVTSTSRRIGFRVFALVTVNDTNATIVASNVSKAVTGQENDTVSTSCTIQQRG